MFCTHCGRALETTHRFCSGCGTAQPSTVLTATAPVPISAPTAPPATQPIAYPARPESFFDRWKLVLVSGAGIFLLLLVITGAILGPAEPQTDELALVGSDSDPDPFAVDAAAPTAEPTLAPETPVPVVRSAPVQVINPPARAEPRAVVPVPVAEQPRAEVAAAQPQPEPQQPASSCDPNYSGCLDPNAEDYDCAGGSGNGPKYTGPVQVTGNDHYDLDRDGDGTACETS